VRISDINNLKDNVIRHFNNYPLQSFKVFNYHIWVEMINTLSFNHGWSKEKRTHLLSNKLNKNTPPNIELI